MVYQAVQAVQSSLVEEVEVGAEAEAVVGGGRLGLPLKIGARVAGRK